MKLILVIAFFVTIASSISTQKSFRRYSVLRTRKLSLFEAFRLRELEDEYDFWKEARHNSTADIMAEGQRLEVLMESLNHLGIDYHIMIEDVQDLIDESNHRRSTHLNAELRQLDWKHYHNHEMINKWMDDLAAKYDFIDTVSIGKSYEGRDMRIIKIEKAGPDAPNIFIEAGIHAREWIAPAMATYIINELIKSDSSDFLNRLNFHVLPSANPDGYEYSMNHDRLWRKTRSETGSPIFGCKGVDGNRNWDFHFGVSGVSSQKCSDVYNGPEPFSEIETRNIRDYLLNLSSIPILTQCLHSYSQLWLYPYGYEYGAVPENVKELRELAEKAADALAEVHGTVFKAENSAELYPAAGASDDWYKGKLKARFSYITELRDGGRYGFLLPPDQIIPSGEELWAAFKVVLAKMIELS